MNFIENMGQRYIKCMEKTDGKIMKLAFAFSLLTLLFGLYTYPLGDPDVFIHLRDGRYYAEHGIQTVHDPFAYTRSDKPIEQIEWLFQICLFYCWKIGGYNLLILLKAFLVTLAISLVGVLVYRRWPEIEAVGFIIGAMVILPLSMILPLLRFFQERPYIITYLFIPVIMLFLDNYIQKSVTNEKKARKWLYSMPLMAIVWVNFHPGFILVFLFLIAQIIEDVLLYWKRNEIIYKHRIRNLSLLVLILFFCGAVNPLGFSIYKFILKTVFSDYLVKIITEWAPPTLANAWGFFVILGITWLFQITFVKGSKISDLIKLLACSYLAVKSYRNIPIFMIVAIPILAGKIRILKEKYIGAFLKPPARKTMMLAAIVVILIAAPILTIQGQAFRLGEVKTLHPKQGLAWLVKNHVEGNVLANDLWGGFVGWQTNNRIKIFIDGRFTIYDKQIFTDYMNIIYGNKDQCLSLLDQYNIQAILLPLNSDVEFLQQLNLSGKWALVFWDHICLLYLRRQDVNQSIIDQYEYKIVHPLDQSRINEKNITAAMAEVDRAIDQSPDSYSPYFLKSQLLLAMGKLTEAKQELEKTVLLAPKYLLYMNLGMTEIRLENFQAAEEDFRIVVGCSNTVELKAQALFFLAQLIINDPARRTEAINYAKKAYSHHPDPVQVKMFIDQFGKKTKKNTI